MNPPFSAIAHVDRRMADAALRHISSALARLADGGRLVAVTGASFAPDNPAWAEAFIQLQERGRVVFSAAINGAVYAKHGTTIDTRLTVIDKRPADDPRRFPNFPVIAPDATTLLGWVIRARSGQAADPRIRRRFPISCPTIPRTVRAYVMRPSSVAANKVERRSGRTRLRAGGLDAHGRQPNHRCAL